VYLLVAVLGAVSWEVISPYVPLKWLPWLLLQYGPKMIEESC
jgi:archaellum component FlaD/FlaE